METMTSVTYSRLAIPSSDDLIFGTAPYPVTLANGLVIGGGEYHWRGDPVPAHSTSRA